MAARAGILGPRAEVLYEYSVGTLLLFPFSLRPIMTSQALNKLDNSMNGVFRTSIVGDISKVPIHVYM